MSEGEKLPIPDVLRNGMEKMYIDTAFLDEVQRLKEKVRVYVLSVVVACCDAFSLMFLHFVVRHRGVDRIGCPADICIDFSSISFLCWPTLCGVPIIS